MTQDCSISSSTADVNKTCESRCLPKGINIVGAAGKPAPRVGDVSLRKVLDEVALPWGYIFIQHMSAGVFEKRLETRHIDGDFKPNCFIHRSLRYRKKPNGKGIMKEEKPTVSGLVFLQGTTLQLRTFLSLNFPQYYLVNNCSTGRPASIPDSVMRPFMALMSTAPQRVTFLREPFVKFAKDHVRLRVLTGIFKGQEGYIVRVNRDRQLIMDLGGYAVAINNVHNEDFEVVE